MRVKKPDAAGLKARLAAGDQLSRAATTKTG